MLLFMFFHLSGDNGENTFWSVRYETTQSIEFLTKICDLFSGLISGNVHNSKQYYLLS